MFPALGSINAYFEHDLFEILLVELPELAEAEFAEVREEDPTLPLHLTLHVNYFLLCWGYTKGVQGLQQILENIQIFLIYRVSQKNVTFVQF